MLRFIVIATIGGIPPLPVFIVKLEILNSFCAMKRFTVGGVFLAARALVLFVYTGLLLKRRLKGY